MTTTTTTKKSNESYVIDPAFKQPWLITPAWLTSMVGQKDAVAVWDGEPVLETSLAEKRGDIAVVSIQGPITRYISFFSQFYGSTPIEALAKDFRTVIDDPSVSAILLNIDCPGGMVNGINEMAEMIYQARGIKPIWAYVGGMGTSAAYFLATAAQKLIIDATAEVGSIGVVQVHYDWRKFDERVGIQEIEIVSSSSPKKRPDPATEEGQKQIRGQLDALADVFIAKVARNRGVSEETVRSDFGQGDIIIGQQAADLGMVDRLGSFEETLKELQEITTLKKEGISMPTENQEPQITKDFISVNHPEIAEAFRSEGYEKGKTDGLTEGKQAAAAEERARIQGIEEIAVPGHESLIAEMKFKDPVSAESAAMRILQAEKKKLQAIGKAHAEDAKDVEGVKPDTGDALSKEQEEQAAMKDIADMANEERG